jgi:hypothetical protein
MSRRSSERTIGVSCEREGTSVRAALVSVVCLGFCGARAGETTVMPPALVGLWVSDRAEYKTNEYGAAMLWKGVALYIGADGEFFWTARLSDPGLADWGCGDRATYDEGHRWVVISDLRGRIANCPYHLEFDPNRNTLRDPWRPIADDQVFHRRMVHLPKGFSLWQRPPVAEESNQSGP